MLRTISTSLLALGVAAALQAQSPCFITPVGTDLLLGDDTTAQGLPLGFTFTYAGVPYTDVCVCSNGYIWFGATSIAGGDFSPTEAELLSGAPRFCPMWTDMNPSLPGSGHVYFDNSTPGQAVITYNGVYAFGSTNPCTMQIVLDSTNSIRVSYGASMYSATGQASAILGASPGAGALSNPVSFATRPVSILSDNFAEVIPATAGVPLPYANDSFLFLPSNPGYTVADSGCTPNQLPAPARWDLVGDGCPARTGPSLYETFTVNNPADLSGLDLSFLPAGGNDYLALPGLSPVYFTAYANNLLAGDDVAIPVTLPFSFPFNGGLETQIHVSSNGFVTIGATNPGSGCCTGSVATMLSGPPRISGYWEDLNPAAAGAVYADLDPATGEFVVSWAGVVEYGQTVPHDFQIALSPSGQFTIRWLSVTQGNGTFLSGYSQGGNTPDTGSTDLSAVNGRSVTSTVVLPLTLAPTAGNFPQVGGTASLDVGNVQALPNGVFSILLISSEAPGGIPLDALGLTGCTAYVNLPEFLSVFALTLGAPTANYSLPIPLDPALYNASFMTQAVSDDLNANAFGYRLSNGVRMNLGL